MKEIKNIPPKDINFVEIGGRIQYIRKKELKMSREKFAEILDVSPPTLGRLERGERKEADLRIYGIVAVLSGYTLEEIIYGKENVKKNITFKKRINYLLNVMDEKQLQYTLESIQRFLRYIQPDMVRNSKKELLKEIENS